MKLATENRKVALIAVCSMVGAALSGQVRADITYTVDSTLDQIDDDVLDGICHTSANTCSLRAAIMQANVATGPHVTIALPAGTFVLTRPPSAGNGDSSGDLNISSPPSGTTSLAISGAGADNTIIDANQIDRAMSIASGRTATVAELSITNGLLNGIGAGGGIYNQGNLTVDRCRLLGNTAYFGGAIGSNGTLLILDSSLSMNTATQRGGAVWDRSASSALPAVTTIIRSTIDSNVAVLGGGLFNDFASMFIVDTTIFANLSDYGGGGIFNIGGSEPATLNIYSSTIFGNEAAHLGVPTNGSGGGILNDVPGVANIRNTLIAGNYRYDTPVPDDCKGSFTAYGFNLFSTTSACTIVNPSRAGLLNSLSTIGALEDNGGPTLTLALLSDSNAIDASGTGGCSDFNGNLITADQRGFARASGIRCDVGAYEYGSIDPSETIFMDGFD